MQRTNLPINQYTALHSLLGTNYGGNGTTNFGLPNLQGNIPVNQGQGAGLSNYNLGQTGDEVSHTLTSQEMPPHNHTMNGSSASANVGQTASNYYGSGSRLVTLYGDPGSPTPMAGSIVGTNSGGAAHPNQHRRSPRRLPARATCSARRRRSTATSPPTAG